MLRNEIRDLHRALGPSGRRAAVDGDAVYNGAKDNAVGTAGLIEIARAFTKLAQPPKRSIVFLSVTAEEQGLLGSQYYSVSRSYSAREDARQHQHGRLERQRPHEGSDPRRLRRVGPGRLRAGRARANKAA